MTAIGFLGLGAMGWPMAARLAGRDGLVVWNRSAPRAAEFARCYGAVAAATPREVAAAVDIVVTCLPTSGDVAGLLDGPEGLLAGLRRGTLFLDCTSGDPATSRRMAAALAPRGVAFADAPVSGGTNGAESGSLTIMVGADAATFERARPVLAAFGTRIEHLGPVGAGDAMKAVNNALLAVNILSVGEALATLVKAGVPAAKAVDVLNGSSGRSFVSETLVPDRVLSGRWPRTFRLALLAKDVAIAQDLLRECGVEGPMVELAGALLQRARSRLDDGADYLEAIRLVEQQAGVEIRG